MNLFSEVDLSAGFAPFERFRSKLGFVPNLFRAQSLLPRAIEAEIGIADRVLFHEQALSRVQKESMLLALAAANGNSYCMAAHGHVLAELGVPPGQIRAILDHHRGLPATDAALIRFATRLGRCWTAIGIEDFRDLRRQVPDDTAVLEAVLVTALTNFLSTLSTGVGAAPDFEFEPDPPGASGAGGADPRIPVPPQTVPGTTPVGLRAIERHAGEFPPFAFFREHFGFIPNIFRAQTLRPDVIEAEARAIESILLTEDVLDRVTKEYILLVVSAANLNTYCVAVHCEMLRRLGVPREQADRVALDHRDADLPAPTVALLDFALRLARSPADYGPADVARIRAVGFDEPQALEAVVMTSLTTFLNTLQVGLAPEVDFEPSLLFRVGGPVRPSAANLSPASGHPTHRDRAADDPDAELVGRARRGEPGAFDELVRRHTPRLYRALLAIGGNPADAEDDLQNALLRALQKLDTFQGRARFSTWLTRIAINEGAQRLRRRRPVRRLEQTLVGEEGTIERPGRLEAWQEDAETVYSREQTRRLVERALMGLPAKYRIVLMLRDLEGMPGEEAAEVLGLKLSTLKTRLLRGRLLLREALAPHFEHRRREKHA